jgi:hypothetical protein
MSLKGTWECGIRVTLSLALCLSVVDELPVLLSSLCCLSFFDDFRIRITLWYFQPLLTINIQEELTATFTDITFYIHVLDRNAILNIYLTLKCLKRDVFYVNENKQRYNKKILCYNTI